MDRPAVDAIDDGIQPMTSGEDMWITMTDLRRHLHRVLREVERGVTFTIVRRGRPVGRVVLHGLAREPELPLFEGRGSARWSSHNPGAGTR